MSDSSDDEYKKPTWVLYKDRDEWKDVAPLPQDDGEEPVVSIAYSKEFSDCYDYLRAVMKSGEKSDRVLKLTADAASMNPSNYTVWQFRREVLKAMDKDLHEELKFLGKHIKSQPKNYQVWHHRKVLIEWLQDASQELALTESMLAKEAKNYHAWQYRQWVMKTFNLFDNEMNYVDGLLDDDVRNNSAWNQRYFVINNTTGFTQEVVQKEIAYCLGKIEIASENESAWNYLRGLLIHDEGGISKNELVSKCCEYLYTQNKRSPFLLGLLVDMCDERITAGSGDVGEHLERVRELCRDLATMYDPIRAAYWQHMAATIERKATTKTTGDDKPTE